MTPTVELIYFSNCPHVASAHWFGLSKRSE
jgi:hypothetical protein